MRFFRKRAKKGQKMLKREKIGQNIWKFGQIWTKFENNLKTGRWLCAIIARNKLLQKVRPWLVHHATTTQEPSPSIKSKWWRSDKLFLKTGDKTVSSQTLSEIDDWWRHNLVRWLEQVLQTRNQSFMTSAKMLPSFDFSCLWD